MRASTTASPNPPVVELRDESEESIQYAMSLKSPFPERRSLNPVDSVTKNLSKNESSSERNENRLQRVLSDVIFALLLIIPDLFLSFRKKLN